MLFSLELEIKPRVASCVLVAIIGDNGDYLTVQMSDGSLIFTVDNGAGAETMTYTPDSKRQLCDGHWHHIKVRVLDLYLQGRGNI